MRDYFLENNRIIVEDLAEYLGVSTSEAQVCIKAFVSLSVLKEGRGGTYYKTPWFMQWLQMAYMWKADRFTIEEVVEGATKTDKTVKECISESKIIDYYENQLKEL